MLRHSHLFSENPRWSIDFSRRRLTRTDFASLLDANRTFFSLTMPPPPRKATRQTKIKTVEFCLLTGFFATCCLLFLGAPSLPGSPTLPSRRESPTQHTLSTAVAATLSSSAASKIEALQQHVHELETAGSASPAAKPPARITGGCHTLKDEAQCVHAVDGRSDPRFGGQACVWCCGESCLQGVNKDEMNKCEPIDYVTGREEFTGRGRSISSKTETDDHGIVKTTTSKMDTCSQPKFGIAVDLDSLKEDSTSTIFVAIAAYRDNLCHETLRSLFTGAAYPERVRVGLVQQNAPEDRDCVEEYCEKVGAAVCRKDQVTVQNIRHVDSKGVNAARYLTQQMLKDEEFWFQVSPA